MDKQLSDEILDLVDELLFQAYDKLDEKDRQKQWDYSIEELQKITSDPDAIDYLKGGLYDLYDVVDCVRRKRDGNYNEID